MLKDLGSLTAKSVKSTALSFQSVHHIHGCHSLSLGVLGVRHSITDHILKENFENTTSLLVDQARDSLDTATASKTTDGWLGGCLGCYHEESFGDAWRPLFLDLCLLYRDQTF